jgi:hypothetical protein
MVRALEAPIHRAVLHYLQTVLPDATVTHVSNEVSASGPQIARAIAKAKHLGMTVGFPDLMVLFGTAQAPIFFEVKAKNGRLSPEQLAFHRWLSAAGYRVAVVRSVDETRDALALFGVKTREAVQ